MDSSGNRLMPVTLTFPQSVVAVNYTYDEDFERLNLDDYVRFAAPEFGGHPCLALFSNRNLVSQFVQATQPGPNADAFRLDAKELLRILQRSHLEFVVLDPNTTNQTGQVFRKHEHLSNLQAWLALGQSGRPSDQEGRP